MTVSKREMQDLVNLIGENVPLSPLAKKFLALMIEIKVHEAPGGTDITASQLAETACHPEFLRLVRDFAQRDADRFGQNGFSGASAMSLFHLFSNRRAMSTLALGDPSLLQAFECILTKAEVEQSLLPIGQVEVLAEPMSDKA